MSVIRRFTKITVYFNRTFNCYDMCRCRRSNSLFISRLLFASSQHDTLRWWLSDSLIAQKISTSNKITVAIIILILFSPFCGPTRFRLADSHRPSRDARFENTSRLTRYEKKTVFNSFAASWNNNCRVRTCWFCFVFINPTDARAKYLSSVFFFFFYTRSIYIGRVCVC